MLLSPMCRSDVRITPASDQNEQHTPGCVADVHSVITCPRVRHEATISRALNQIKAHKRHIFTMGAADTIYSIFVFKCALSPFVTAAIMHAVQVPSSAPSLMTLGTAAEAHWLPWFQCPQRGFFSKHMDCVCRSTQIFLGIATWRAQRASGVVRWRTTPEHLS